MIKTWLHFPIALAAGALYPLAFAPLEWWPLAPASLAVWALCLERTASLRGALLTGWLFGLGLWLVGVHWVYDSIHEYGGAPAVAAALLTLGYAAGLGLLQALVALIWHGFRSGRRAVDMLLLLPAGWVVVEWVKSWFLTGLPWLDLGVSAVDWWAGGWLPLLGTEGTGWLIAALAGSMAWAARAGRYAWLASAGATLLLAFSGWQLQRLDWVEHSGADIEVKVVQTNLSAYQRWARGGLEKSLEQNLQLTGRGARLVLWPETSLPMRNSWPGADKLVNTLHQFFAERGQTLAMGLLHAEDGAIYNAMQLVGLDEGLYLKSRLVPFGEFTPAPLMPLRKLFQFPASDMRSGPASPEPLVMGGVPLAIAICYEIAYRSTVLPRAGQAGLILTTSNDSWFGTSSGPWQHLQIARARSAETRRWTLRSTNGGIGGIIDDRGAMHRMLIPFGRGAVSATVPVLQGATPAVMVPQGFYAALGFLLLAGLYWRRRHNSRKSLGTAAANE